MFTFVQNAFTRWVSNPYRRLFRFWDGRRYRCVDPMVILRRLGEVDNLDMENDPKRLKSKMESVRLEATREIAAAVRHAFDLPVYDGRKGLTEEELCSLLGLFTRRMQALKKNTANSLSAAPSTESPDA